MATVRKTLCAALAAALLGTTAGCSMFHELQPHRLWRWNRYSPPTPGHAHFSLSDSVPLPGASRDDSAVE